VSSAIGGGYPIFLFQTDLITAPGFPPFAEAGFGVGLEVVEVQLASPLSLFIRPRYAKSNL